MSSQGDPTAVRQIGASRFEGEHNCPNYVGRLYGGQALGHALAAATRTVDGRPAHSLHAYFLRAGAADRPVTYDVASLRDGRAFATRRVTAIQDERAIFEMLCSFHDPEPGFRHAASPPRDVPPPEALPSLADYAAANADCLPARTVQNFARRFAVELRLIDPDSYFFARPQEARRRFWVRLADGAPSADAATWRCRLAFMSDLWLVGVAALPHRFPSNGEGLLIASIDHGLWFHHPADPGEWLLYETESPFGGDGRGLARGMLFDREGALVASAVQEALFRPLD